MPRQLVRSFGTCLDFDGVDDVVSFADHASIDLPNTHTIAAWVKPASFGEASGGRIVDKDPGAGGYALFLQNNAGERCIRAFCGATGHNSNLGIIQLGVWQHVAVTYDKDAGSNQVKFYYNGVAVGTSTDTDANTNTSASLRIGSNVAGDRAFHGKIDEVKVYDRALTATEIQNEFIGANQSTSGLVLHTKFDEGSGTAAVDSSGTQANGTITGATYSSDVVMVNRSVAGTRINVRNQGNAVRTVAASTQSVRWTNTPFLSPTVVSANMWLKLRAQTASTFDVPFGFGNTRWFFIFNGTSNRPAFNTKISTAEKSSGYIAKALTLNKWFFLSGTYDPNAGANNLTLRVYDENGVLYDSISSTQTGDMDSTAQPLCFGNDPSRGFNMSVDGDDIRVFSRALTSTEQDLLAKGYAVNTSGLELWAKCDESSGNLADSSGNGRTGTNTNTCTFVSSFMTAVRTAVS